MNKFCPNCGKLVPQNTRFCPNCGHDFGAKETTKPVSQPTNNHNSFSQPQKTKKHFNKKGLMWTFISIIIVIIIAIGGIFIYDFHQDQEAAVAINHMSKKKLAGMTLAYVHFKYPKDHAWNEVYDEALNSGIRVTKHKSYNLNGYTVKAARGNNVYIINDKVAFTISNEQEPAKATLELADGKKNLGTVNAVKAYKTVMKDNNSASVMKKINSKSGVSLTNTQLAILVGFAHSGDRDFTEEIQMNKRTNNPDYYEESEDGFHQLQMGADGPSAIFFKQVGRKVIVKFQDVNNAKDAADAPEKTVEYSISDLINRYYSTADQQRKVDDLAEQLIVRKSDEDDIDDEDEASSSSSERDEDSENSSTKKSNLAGKYSNLPLVKIPSAMQGTWYAAGLLSSKLDERVNLGTSTIDNKKLYYLAKSPSDSQSLKELKEEHKNDYIMLEKPRGTHISYTLAGTQTDATGYELINLEGIPCLVNVSGVPSGIYFKSSEIAKKFTNKYKNDKNLTEEIMDKLE
ncbi:zinc-ribbon domain-containing protein [Lactobacillus sp. LL6]|nr:zinc-ribbon domain-containing protein [Lactobacillus sp. LL6]